MKKHYDIVILGAGMVGSSLAAALIDQARELKLSIALIESKELSLDASASEYQPSFDSRATALSYGSSLIYQQLSVWQKLSEHVQAVEHIHVSDKGRFGATRLNAKDEQVPALGYVIENKWLGDVLLNHLQHHENKDCIDFLCPATVNNISRVNGNMQLIVSKGSKQHDISASLVVMADGGRSSLREQLGIDYREQDYQQHALVVNIALDRSHQNIAYERFTDNGPIALLPLSKKGKVHRSGLIWTIPNDEIDQVLEWSDEEFIANLQNRFGYRAGRILDIGERFSYPLKLQSAQEQVRSGVVIVGNAAHTLHPIAGQGFNLALRGVMSLAKTLLDRARHGETLGDYETLLSYEKSRLSDQQSTIQFSDKSMKLFCSSNPLLALGRDVGLQCLDICPPAKTLFARSAMGLSSPMSYLG